MIAREVRSFSAAVGLAAIAFGCVPAVVTGRVSSALYAPPPPRATFTVVGSDGHTASLAERQIQAMIAEQMVALGFTRAENRDSSDLAVLYSYGIGAGTTQVSSSPDFVWGGQKVQSQTQYPRTFQITVVELGALEPSGQRKVLWQGELYSAGSSADLGEMSTYFVTELFRSFGKSETNRRFRRIIR